MSIYWGIDLGGTKIEIACFSIEDDKPKVLLRKRSKTNSELGYENIIKTIVDLSLSAEQDTGIKIDHLGLGHPGVHCPRTGLIKNSNSITLLGKNLNIDLVKAFKDVGKEIKLSCANDANCFALAENIFGAGRGYKTMFGVIMGTGVGGGVIIDGKALYGAHGICGEWGHIIIEPEGESCYCGKRGCVETIICGPSLEAYYEKLSGKKLALSEILKNVNQDKNSKLTKERLIYFFGKGLSYITNILDPECIVIGGGVSNIDLLYTEGRDKLSDFIFNSSLDS